MTLRIQYLQDTIRTHIPIPGMPPIAAEAARLADNPRTPVSDLALLLSKDRFLTMKLIHLANSPFVGFPRECTTLESAILALGLSSLKEIVTGIALLHTVCTPGSKALDHRTFWDHSAAVGMAARKYATGTGCRSSEAAFSAGFMHDVGILIEERFFPGEFSAVTRAIRSQAAACREAEENIFGLSHSQIGGWVAERWGYDDDIVEAIRCHEHPAMALLAPELAAVVNFADVLCTRLRIGCFEFDSLTTFSEEVLQALHFESENAVNRHCAGLRGRTGKEFLKADPMIRTA